MAAQEIGRMSLGSPQRQKTPLGVIGMLAALVLAAFLGASAGLVWEKSGWFSGEAEDEMVTHEEPAG